MSWNKKILVHSIDIFVSYKFMAISHQYHDSLWSNHFWEYHHFSSLCAVNLGYYDNNLETQIISIVPGTPSTSWQKFFLIELESEKSFLSWYTTVGKNYVPICFRSNHHRLKLLSEETLGREELFFKIFLIEGNFIIFLLQFALTIFLLDYSNLKG